MIVHLTNHAVDVRYAWASTIDEVVEKNGGDPADYLEGDYPVGSTRDPETGIVTPYAPPVPTDADIANRTSLSRRQLFEEIDDLLPSELQPAETWLPAVITVAPGLSDDERSAALSAVSRSQIFEGSSPLFLLVGAALTPSLDADEVHQLIIRASER